MVDGTCMDLRVIVQLLRSWCASGCASRWLRNQRIRALDATGAELFSGARMICSHTSAACQREASHDDPIRGRKRPSISLVGRACTWMHAVIAIDEGDTVSDAGCLLCGDT